MGVAADHLRDAGFLRSVGFNDKYIQQDHPDQEAAFQVAFTLQAFLCVSSRSSLSRRFH